VLKVIQYHLLSNREKKNKFTMLIMWSDMQLVLAFCAYSDVSK